jgi:hypothetical protein
MKFTRQLCQTSHAKAFGDIACRRCVHVTLNAKTTLVQSIESVKLCAQLLTFIMVKSVHCPVSVVLREPGGFVYPSLALNGRCKIYFYCRACGWFLIWL